MINFFLNRVIREFQETEAHKVNRENQAFQAWKGPQVLWDHQETRALLGPLGTEALRAIQASLALR